MHNYANEIKDRVPLLDLLEHYGFHPVFDRIPCPFHNGKDRNMLVSNNIYKCFVCGEHGDIFAFVQRYFGLDFPSAIAKINDDFMLGFPIEKKLTRAELDEANKREKERRARAVAKRRRLEEIKRRYEDALQDYTTCDVILMRCAPISPSTGFSDAFAYAVKNRDRAWYELKEAEADLFRYRQEEKAAG